MAKRATKRVKNTKLVLSGGMKVTLNELPKQSATELAIALTRSQLIKADGTVQDDESLDKMTDEEVITMRDESMGLVDTILSEDGVLEVSIPEDSAWLFGLTRKSYVRQALNPRDLANLDNPSIEYKDLDQELLKFMYVRYIGIREDSDFTAILGAAFSSNADVAKAIEDAEDE